MFKVHHIALSVSNIEKSKNFYSIFWFEEKLYFQSENKDLEIVHLKMWDFLLELFCYKNFQKMPETSKEISTDLPIIWVKHFWLKVDDIEKSKIELEKLGICKKISINTWRTKIKYFFIKDPDWILLEIVEDKRKF